MELVHQKTLEQVIKMLDAIGVAYAIKDTDGNLHGTLQIADTTPKRTRNLTHPFGAISAHIRPYLENLGVGAIAYIPCGEFGYKTLMGSLMSMLISNYGKGNFKTAYNATENTVEVIRFG